MDTKELNRWQSCADNMVALLCEWQNRTPDVNTYTLVHNLMRDYKLRVQLRVLPPDEIHPPTPVPTEILDQEYLHGEP